MYLLKNNKNINARKYSVRKKVKKFDKKIDYISLGLTKGLVREDALDDKKYTGSLISLLENTDTFIKNSWKIKGMDKVEYEVRFYN